jgi:phospholipase/lecithinase/hemolysin
MLSQVEKFKTGGFTTGGSADSEALYVLWGGPNDFESSNLLSGTETVDAVIARAVGNLGDMIEDLATIGARNFLVPGILDLGNTAKFLQPQYDDNLRLALTEGSKDFNSQLMKKINELETANQAIDIRYFDVFGLMTAIRNNPSAYGFTNVTDQCFVFPNPPCAEPDSYLFWEGIHPSAAFHERLAAGFAAAVPEPGTLTLLGLGVLGLAFSRRAKTIVSTDLGCDFS